MLEIEKTKHNLFTFFESEDRDGETEINCVELDKDVIGEYIIDGDSEMGHVHQIILLKNHKTDPKKFDKLDMFEAILTHPPTYIKQMIDWEWYGVIIRKSTKSQEIVELTLDNLKKFL